MQLKLFQGSALSSNFLRCESIFDLSILSDLPKTCDQAVTEFNNFLFNKPKKQQIEFPGFEVENKWLDNF